MASQEVRVDGTLNGYKLQTQHHRRDGGGGHAANCTVPPCPMRDEAQYVPKMLYVNLPGEGSGYLLAGHRLLE